MISRVFSHRFLLLVLLLAVFSLFPNKAQTVGIKPFPILNFKSNLSEVQLGSSLQLSWTSQNANECIAGADWSGEKSLSGNEILIPEEFGEKVYSLTCSGPGGTVTKELEISVFKTIQGVVVDGYLRDAKVFLDKNSNFKHDNDEFYTFSDDVGVYQIRFGKRLISIEGFDVQTGNYLKNFFMMSEPNNANDFIVISPITTVNAFFRNKEIFHQALGIDEELNIITTDPIENLDKDKNVVDLYEKGIKIGLLAYSLQNIINDQNAKNENTKESFEILSNEIEDQYLKRGVEVDIASKDFLEKLFTSIDAQLDNEKLNKLINITSNFLEVVNLKVSDQGNKAIMNFGYTTLNEDLKKVLNETISTETYQIYQSDILQYISDNQNIDINELASDYASTNSSPPVFTSSSVFYADENSQSIGLVEVVDEDTDRSELMLWVSDGSGELAIDNDGRLYFKSDHIPDFETRSDYGCPDSIYPGNYRISVNDGSNTVTQQICVYINDIPNEKGPVFISTPDFAAPSNSLKIGEILAIDPEGDFVQFSTSDNKLRIEPLPNPFSEAYKAALKYNPDIDYQSLGAFTSMITASDGLNETNQSISITSQNLPPLISNNLIDLDENIVEIPLSKLSITDSEGDDISVTIKPNFVYGIDTMLGNNELLPGYATDYEEVESYTTLGNLDGSPYELTSDFFANNVKIISDIIIADGVKFTAYNYVWSEETSSANFPEITIGSGRFEATSAKLRNLHISGATDGDVLITRSSLINCTFEPPGSSSRDSRYMINLNYFENVNTGYLIDIYYPEEVFIVNNVFYNTGQFSLALSSDFSFPFFNFNQNIFVNSNIMETYPSWNYDQTKVGHIKYWASNNNQITLSANQYLNQNIHAFIGNEDMNSQNEYFGSSGDLSQRVLDEFYGESTISGAVANLRNSSLDEHELDIKAQPKLIYQNGSFQLDFPADYEALHDQFSYILEISDGVNDPVIERLDITVSDVNEPPLIISNDQFSINENNDEIGVILALDPENDELFYSSDDEAFSFQGNNLFFTTPPDYEEQSLYTTTVSISDGNNSTSKYIEVQILDVDEKPQFTSTSNFNIDENSYRVGKITATDGDGDDVTIYVEDANFYLNDSNVLFFNNAPDYELQTNYEVVVFATDGSNIASETINIGINNLNDNPPVLNSYIYYVDENTEGPIATLDVTDADGDDISFPYFESWGSINSEGQIFVPNIPDYETSDQYNGSILISDGVNEISEHIYIYVNNLNDNAPSFTFTGPFSAPENQLYVDNLISATDDDGDDLTFSLANEDAADLSIFSSNSEGNLFFNNAPNFEEKDSYSFDVIVSDGVFSASERITVAITDQNDLPQFTSSSIFYSDENQQAIGTVVATDEDGQSLVYSISSSQDDGRGVNIDGVTGTLFFDADELPDYEDGASRTVTVTATEQSDAQMSSTQSVQISINNLNDNEPTILGYNEYGGIDVDENSSFVKDFDVDDSDGDLNEHVFSISGIDADVFTLESSGGRLVFTHSGQVDHENPLDDDANNDYEITISVTDGLYTNSTDFTINVLNLNDNSPVFTCEPDNGNPNYEFQCVDTVITIDESDQRSPNEQETVGVFTANDPDGDLLTFSIPTDSGLYSNWSLLNNTNYLTLFDGEDLSYSIMKSYSDAADYEVASSYSGHILVSDGENTESRAVTINLNNINDNAPETTFTCYAEIQPADSLNYCYVDENDSSLILGSFTYEDADGSLNELSLSLNEYCSASPDCFGNSYTSINSELDGILIDSAFDYEVDQTTHYMYLTITDGENSTNEVIYFEVRDVNDAPEFTSNAIFSIDENQTSSVGSVAASDQDGDSITYSIRQGSFNWSSFTIDSVTGELSLIAPADYETLPSYVLEIYADDGTDVTSQMVTVNVNDVNEAPQFTSSTTQRIDEGQTSVGYLAAADEDFTEDTLTFSIIDGDDYGFLSITADGLLTINNTTDYESQQQYDIVVRVSDGSLYTDQSFEVVVTNLNDNSPIISFPSSMDENDNELGYVSIIDYDYNSQVKVCIFSDVYTFQFGTSGTTEYLGTTYNSSCLTNSSPTSTSYTSISGQAILGPPLNYESGDGTEDFVIFVHDWNKGDYSDSNNMALNTYTVNINDVDDLPYWVVDGVEDDWQYRGSVYVDENETILPVDIGVVDEDGDNIAVSLGTGSATEYNMNYNSSTSLYEITFKQAPDKEVGGPLDLVMYAVTDNWTADLNIAVYVNDVDEPPVFSSGSAFAVDENYISNGVVDIGYVVASDPESADVRYFITDGADQDKVSIDSITGLLTLNDIPNYESQSSYSIEVTAADYWITSPTQSGLYDTQNITISVNDLDEAPIIVDANGDILIGDIDVTVDEGETFITNFYILDEDGDQLSYSFQGDGSAVSYDMNSGILNFNSPPDYETDNFYEVVFCALSTSYFACIDFNININNIYEAPIISTTSFTVDENETSIGRVIASTDSGATLSFSIPGQNSNLTNTNNAFTQDDHSELDETDFYVLSGDPSTQNISLKIWDIDDYLSVSLKDSAGVEQYTEIFSGQGGEIDINNFLSEEGSTIDLELINTGQGYTMQWELKVDDEVIYSNGCGTWNISGCANNSNSEGTVYQSTIYLGTANEDGIIIDEQTGDLEFNTAPDFETQDTYTVDVNVTDGTSTTTETITINITDVNEAPVFDSLSYDYSVIEGNKDIGSISATDEDGDTVVYSVSLDYVADGSSLSGDIITVDSTGLLSFIDPANFENATSYTFDITASDGELSSTESVTVKLINKNGIVNTGEIYLCDFSVHGNYCSYRSRLAASNDGSRVAVSDTHNSNGDGISVFEYSNGSWAQIGSTLPGHTGVDISGDGSRVITSTWIADNEEDTDEIVRVYEFDESTQDWNQIGDDITPPSSNSAYGINLNSSVDEWGNDVSIDDDGDRIVIGAYKTFNSDGGIFIYDFAENCFPSPCSVYSWQLITDFGNYLVPQRMLAQEGYGGGKFGWDVEISDSGDVISASSYMTGTNKVFFYENDLWWERCAYGDTPSEYNNAGCTNVLNYGSAANSIALKGNSSPTDMHFVVGSYATSSARIWRWSESWDATSNFKPFAEDVENFRPNQFFYTYTGWSTSLSDDGSILAVGAPRSDKSDGDDFNGTDSGEVKIFTNSGYTNTEAANIDFSAQYGQYCGEDLDVSGDGQKLFILCPNWTDYPTSSTFGKVMTYEIEINDIDNGVPYFTSDSVFTADENGTAIGTVTAADSDGDTLSFSITSSDMSINSSSGELTFDAASDYETQSSYTAQIFVTDGTNTTAQDITVNIVDLDEEAPVFTSVPVFQYSEDDTSLSIGFVTATDDIGPITYTISGSGISIDSSSGELTFDEQPDYETADTYSRVVSASDADNTTNQYISVSITDVDDEAPIINVPSTLYFPENYQRGNTNYGSYLYTDSDLTNPVEITVSDADTDDSPHFGSLIYSISASTISTDCFDWNKYNGELEIDGPVGTCTLDYESYSNGIPDERSLTVDLTVTDGTNSTTEVVNIEVINLNDNLPEVDIECANSDDDVCRYTVPTTHGSPYYLIDEGETVLFNLTPEDADGNTPELLYTSGCTVGNIDPNDSTANNYTLDISLNSNNQVVLEEAFDFENSYMSWDSCTVFAQFDSEGDEVSVSMSIKWDNINDSLPYFTVTEYYIDECNGDDLSEYGYECGGTPGDPNDTSDTRFDLSSVQDSEGNQYKCVVSGGADASLVVDPYPNYGGCRFDIDDDIDYETKTSYSFEISLYEYDGSSIYGSANVESITLFVNDVNDNYPVITSSSTFYPVEEQAAIGTVTATDNDAGSLTYSILNVDPAYNESPYLTISIDENTGELSFACSPPYTTSDCYPDYEQSTGRIWTATVKATDSENTFGPWSDWQNITIFVINTNDNSPSFTSSDAFSVDEGTTTIGTVEATDVDGDQVTFSVGSSDVSIDSASGVLTFNSAPDYESQTSYTFTVTASDGTNSADQEITVTINNINDNTPSITSLSTFSVAEGVSAIGTVTAIDGDGDNITFSINSTNSSNTNNAYPFDDDSGLDETDYYQVNAGAGISTQDLDLRLFDIDDEFTVTLIDSSGNEQYSYTASYNNSTWTTIQVNDYLSTTGSTIELELYNGGSGFTMGWELIRDGEVLYSNSCGTFGHFGCANDSQSTGIVYSATIALGSNDYIDIDESSGDLSFNITTDYDSQSQYTATVNASDGLYSTSQNITVDITQDSNPAPTVSSESYTLNLLPKDQNAINFSLSGSDSNGDSLTYSLVTNPTYGSVTLSGSSVTYTTNSGHVSAQTDSFTFKANDGTSDSNIGTISIDLKTDPLYKYQWHLDNTEQSNFASTTGTLGDDLNVDSVINSGYTGSGVIINVVDEGLELAHEDLADNIVPGSYDLVDNDTDPTNSDASGDHGTSVAGISASVGWNNLGGRGVAPAASLIGYNFLKNQSGSNQWNSWGINPPGGVQADIYNLSYGYGNSGTYNWPYTQANTGGSLETALESVTTDQRNNKGALLVKSSGNDFNSGSSSSTYCGSSGAYPELACTEAIIDTTHQFPYTVVTAAIRADDTKSSYSTPGPSIWISGYGGEYGYNSNYVSVGSGIYDPAIMTTDQSGCTNGYVGANSAYQVNEFNNNSGGYSENADCNYVSTFNGTSSAAPSVSGVIALMLEANPDLTWRDVKHIIASTADKIDENNEFTLAGITQYEWETNAAGFDFHNWYGFGKINAAEAVQEAENYSTDLGTFSTTNINWATTQDVTLPYGTSPHTIDISSPTSSNNNFIEQVQLGFKLNHIYPDTIGMTLVSPSGTEVNILQPFTNVYGNHSGLWITVGVNAFYGEQIDGTWTLKITDYLDDSQTGVLQDWYLDIFFN